MCSEDKRHAIAVFEEAVQAIAAGAVDRWDQENELARVARVFAALLRRDLSHAIEQAKKGQQTDLGR